METPLKRKHVRTRMSEVSHSADNLLAQKLIPGKHRMFKVDRRSGQPRKEYIGSFILNDNHTVSFYGSDLSIEQVQE